MTLGIMKKSRKFSYTYRAKVEDNMDPKQYGRIKARIYPMFADVENIPTSQLPWTVPAMSIFDGAGLTITKDQDGKETKTPFGCTNVPKVGTFVFVFFRISISFSFISIFLNQFHRLFFEGLYKFKYQSHNIVCLYCSYPIKISA